ncbi:hypothetical protein AAES_37855 [Amazona aestiva]|uniref:Uncharacterized protein n=1 Tax=Amazona aestiva TaxID=12930 RepID=A0A0Q3UUD6_AMAAE|nr:hypothetical protein AAES_37855 [Amazona aestiva]
MARSSLQVANVQELEEELGKRPGQEELNEAQAALAAAEEEKLRLRTQLQEAEQRLRELQEEVGLLQEKLAQDPLRQSQAPEVAAPPPPPPPPPPLPPPAPTVPMDPLLAIRQRKGLVNLQRCKPEAEDAKARAVQEMMERIKNGVVLRPAKDRDPPGQEEMGEEEMGEEEMGEEEMDEEVMGEEEMGEEVMDEER